MSKINDDIFSADIRKAHDSVHSLESFLPLYSGIDLVYVLSGRGSVLKQSIDHAMVADPEDDYYRMMHGVEIAQKIYAASGVRVPIFYNGRVTHNKHLQEALQRGDFSHPGVFYYPKEFFIIRSISPENTIGQAKSFKEFLQENKFSLIAFVSSAYHLPRVSRTFARESPTVIDYKQQQESNLERANLLLFGIDRAFRRPGIEKDLKGELEAMKNYSSGATPSISRCQGSNTFLNYPDILYQFSFSLQKKRLHFLTVNIKREEQEMRRWERS